MMSPIQTLLLAACLAAVSSGGAAFGVVADELSLTIAEAPDRLLICYGDRPLATYVFHHDRIPRPFFCNLFSLTGERVSRSFPPGDGEALDHDTLHPGVWLSFGDIAGYDFWRNRCRTEHVEFLARPLVMGNRGSFSVRNAYRSGDATVCREICQYTVSIRPHGYRIAVDSEFSSDQQFSFGDQEEMGFGIRMTAGLCVSGDQGRITNSSGAINEAQVWGKHADWCDFRGTINDRQVGAVVMAHPQNPARSWFHARDYGLLVANPFGRQAFTGGKKSELIVAPGEKLRWRFAIFIHSTNHPTAFDPQDVYREYIQ